jgi:hypothetical protein
MILTATQADRASGDMSCAPIVRSPTVTEHRCHCRLLYGRCPLP